MLNVTKKLKESRLFVPQVVSNRFLKPSISFRLTSGRLQVEIETERLFIRSYKDADFECCVSLYGNELIIEYFDHGKARTRLEVESLIREKGDKYFVVGKPFGLFSVYCKTSKAFLGQVDFLPSEELGVAEVGFILHKQYHNQGFCTEAVSALIFDYVECLNNNNIFECEELPINRIIATVHPKNRSSRRVLEKLGMTLDKIEDRFNNLRLWFSIPVFLIAQKTGLR